MIVRIVKLTFREEEVETFKKLFEQKKDKIRNFEGCLHLKLLQGLNQSNVFFTYSHWDSEDDLNNYRYSELFAETWAATKLLFSAKAEAWSVNENVVLT